MVTNWWPPERDLETEGQVITVMKSIFADNDGRYGGLVASNLGTLPKLSILQNEFTGNKRAGELCCPEYFGEIVLSGNTGASEPDEGECGGFRIWTYPGTQVMYCLDIDEEIDGSLT